MGCDKNSVMVVHGGGMYGDKEKTKKRWCEQFKKLPERVQKRLVLENCEKCFHIEDCLEISKEINIPVVFDTHHHECYIQLHPDMKLNNYEFYIKDILNTWKRREIKPKFHISNQREGKRVGAHSDYIYNFPSYLLNKEDEIDIMVEAKCKEKSVKELVKKYL